MKKIANKLNKVNADIKRNEQKAVISSKAKRCLSNGKMIEQN